MRQILLGVNIGMFVAFPIGILAGVATGQVYMSNSQSPKDENARLIASGTLVACGIVGGIIGGIIGNQNALKTTIKFI